MSLCHYWPRGVGVKANLDNVTKYEVLFFLKASLSTVQLKQVVWWGGGGWINPLQTLSQGPLLTFRKLVHELTTRRGRESLTKMASKRISKVYQSDSSSPTPW